MATTTTHTKQLSHEALTELLAAALPGLRKSAYRYTRNAARADDLVHDTVVRILRFQDSFRVGSNFMAWASTILSHTFINGYRRRRREIEIINGAGRADVEVQLRSLTTHERASHPEQAWFSQALSDDVVRALAALSEDFRTVVVLCDLQGHSYREVAEVLQCPLGTVMSRLHRGRRLLAQQLSEFASAQGIGLHARAEPKKSISYAA